jgi:UDP-3-O-[3-hydroxymyristoyl] glucosamine N-acyltransferase
MSSKLSVSLGELSDLVSGKLVGDKNLKVFGLEDLSHAGLNQLAICFSEKESKIKTKANAVLTDKEYSQFKNQIVVKNSRVAMAIVLNLFYPQTVGEHFVHPTAIVDSSVKIQKPVFIGPYCVIEKNVEIAKGCKLISNVYIGANSKLAENICLHPGVVIGSDGYGYADDGTEHLKIVHRGGVVIEKNVEIGANSVVNQGTFRPTTIGAGTKLDSHVHIAHNAQVGERVLIVSQSNVAGSAVIGDETIIAGRSGVADHVTLGKRTKLLAFSAAIKDHPDDSVLSGFPAEDHSFQLKLQAFLRSLFKKSQKVKTEK